MLAGALKSFVRRAFTGGWEPVDDGDAIFVIGRFEMALVTNKDITVVQREREGFELGSFEDAIRWTESLQDSLSHCGMGHSFGVSAPIGGTKKITGRSTVYIH